MTFEVEVDGRVRTVSVDAVGAPAAQRRPLPRAGRRRRARHRHARRPTWACRSI